MPFALDQAASRDHRRSFGYGVIDEVAQLEETSGCAAARCSPVRRYDIAPTSFSGDASVADVLFSLPVVPRRSRALLGFPHCGKDAGVDRGAS